jgi:hypothetical protein
VGDLDEPLGIAQPRGVHHLGPDKRRHDHRILERQRAPIGQPQLTRGDLLHGDVEDRLDLLPTKEHAQQRLAAG